MKKISFLIIFLLISDLFSQEQLQNICHFNHGRKEGLLFTRAVSEIESEFDETGNGLVIDDIGNIYIVQCDMQLLYKVDMQNKNLKLLKKIDFLETGSEGISIISDKYYFCKGSFGRFKLFDKDFNQIFKIRMFDWNMRLDTRESFYEESTNILFFRDSNEALHCIVHPGMNDEENQKNYKNPEQTLELFENEVTINGTSIRVTKRGSLFVNGNYTYWGQLPVGDYVYQINRDDVFCYDQETAENTFNVIISDDSEEIESIAIHPSGDIYVLRMNWQTNTHNLYYIENTWDSEWREQWYKEHPNAAKP